MIERDVRLSDTVWVRLEFENERLLNRFEPFVGLWGREGEGYGMERVVSPCTRVRVLERQVSATVTCKSDLVARGDGWVFALGPHGIGAAAFDDAEALPSWHIACPFRQLFSWILDQHGGVLVHTAAVFMRNGSVALIAGPSGSGKSSLAGAIARMRPFSYLGDDWVPVYQLPNGEWCVTALYRSLKLSSAMADVCRLGKPEFTSKDKQVFRVADMALGGDHKVGSIVVPSIAKDGLALKKIEPKEAVKRIAPSTLLQSSGVSSRALDRVASLCESVPCYSLSMSSEFLRSVHVLVQELF